MVLLPCYQTSSTHCDDDSAGIKDKTYHLILQALFHCALSEKRSFFSGRKGSKTSTTSSNRLEKCGEALRLVVSHAGTKLKRKTMMAVIDHITQSLPGPDGEFVEPMVKPYFKALDGLLTHPANVELLATLNGDGWYTCADFLLSALSRFLEGGGDRDFSSASRASPAPGTHQSTGRSKLSVQVSAGSHIERSTLEVVLQGLYSLSGAPNAPLHKRAESISSGAMQVLNLRNSNLSFVHALAFGIVTSVLAVVQGESLELAGKLSVQLVSEIIHWWQSRSAGKAKDELIKTVKDEIVKSIFLMYLPLLRQASLPGNEVILRDIRDLAEALRNEYARRDSDAQLRLDDLTFSSPELPEYHFQTRTFASARHSPEGERRWGFVQALALLEAIIWDVSVTRQEPREEERPRKRRKVFSFSSRIREGLGSADTETQMVAMHLTPFFLTASTVQTSEIASIVDVLSSLIGSKHSPTSNWAMLALSRYALLDFIISLPRFLTDQQLRPFVTAVWLR